MGLATVDGALNRFYSEALCRKCMICDYWPCNASDLTVSKLSKTLGGQRLSTSPVFVLPLCVQTGNNREF